MYEALKGKKLLIIGSDATNMNIIRAAHEMGVYVIAVDGITDYSKAPAKVAADAAWDIDYSDTEAVAQRCLEEKVDGVFAGYSEFRVLSACRIANRLGLPFYATEAQIELTRNKRSFKDACQEYNIPTPKDYCFSYPMSDADKDLIEYPVIVKPADYAGRKGISVCYNRQELDVAVEYAVSKSASRTIIVEDYLEGVEFASIYTLKDGQISLSCVNEKVITEDQERKTGLCEFLLSPADSYQRYMDELDGNIRNFIRGIGAKNGPMFFQGIVTKKKIYVFEMGYRINGNNDFRIVEKNNGLSFMKMTIAHSLCGSMCDDLSKDNPLYKNFECALLFYAHGGTVAKLDYQKILSHPNVTDATEFAWVGKTIPEDGSTAQKILTAKITAATREDLLQTVEFAQQNITVEDAQGNNMLFKFFDARKFICGEA